MKEDIWNRFFLETRYIKHRDVLIHFFYWEFAQNLSDFQTYVVAIGGQIRELKSQELAKRYLSLLSPLCEKFGMFLIKNELDDLCFFILYPEEAEKLLLDIEKFDKKHKKFLDITREKLITLAKSANIECVVAGRKKELYSLFLKMQKKWIEKVDDINDLIAFRIIISDENYALCFRMLNIIHDTFFPVVSRFKDYITIPKINGYQSIHTGVRIEQDREEMLVEIQICTQSMYEKSEQWFTSHFHYKNGAKTYLNSRDKILLETIQHHSEKKSENRLLALTYTGDIIALDEGATVLDFAYKVHSDLGNFAEKALVNGKHVPIFHPLKEGDVIRILLAEKKQVNSSWIPKIKNQLTLKKIHDAIWR